MFKDLHRVSRRNKDALEVQISDAEDEEFLNFSKKCSSIKRSSRNRNDNALKKRSPYDTSLTCQKRSFYKTTSHEHLQSSEQLKKVKIKERKRSVKRQGSWSKGLLDINKHTNQNHKTERSFIASDMSLSSPDISEDELPVFKVAGGNSVLPAVQNMPVLEPRNECRESCFTLNQCAKFSVDCDHVSAIRVTPRAKKTKQSQLLKDTGTFSNALRNSEVSQCPVISNVDSRDCSTLSHSLVTSKSRKTVPHCLLSDSKRNVSGVTPENFKRLDDMCQEILNDAKNIAQCSNFNGLQVTSKIKKINLNHLKTGKRSLIDASLNIEVSSDDECLEISESSDSAVIDTSLSQGFNQAACMLKEGEEVHISDSDHSNNSVQLNLFQGENTLSGKSAETKNVPRENPHCTSTNDCPTEKEVLQKATSWIQSGFPPVHKGSDWVKYIKLYEESVPNLKRKLGNHKEKRKKHLPGGFAEQAQKLRNSEKSYVRVWSYEKNSKFGTGQSKYLCLKIQLFSVLDTFVITNCEILSGNDGIKNRSENEMKECFIKRCSTKEYSGKQIKEPSCEDKGCPCTNDLRRKVEQVKDCVVAIKPGTWEDLKLTTDSVIKIFPPWQTLWIDSLNVHVLLCTYFIEALSTPSVVEKSLSEKVLYSRPVLHVADATHDAHNSSALLQSHFSSDHKQHSFFSCPQDCSDERRLKKSSLLLKKSIFSRDITRTTQVGEIVVVKGIITKVNEENSVMWLECDQCQNENLLEDEQGIKYCEICCRPVTKPTQKRKVEVIMQLPNTADVVLFVQLFSPTIEKVFPFTDEGQPVYEISDILHSSIGPIVCCVISCGVTENKVTYHLEEMS